MRRLGWRGAAVVTASVSEVGGLLLEHSHAIVLKRVSQREWFAEVMIC